MTMSKITALILAKNEETNIRDCIQSVHFVDEILVIDDFSIDLTSNIAREMGATVIQRSMDGDWGSQQTFAIQHAQSEWVLFIDADERISELLAKEILDVVADGTPQAYWILRENKFHYNQATHGVLRPDYVNRLFPAKNSYVTGYVHPTIVTPYPNKKLQHVMYHYTYDNWDQYLSKLNNYTRLAAEKYKENNKKCGFMRDIVLRPLWAFIKVYILNKGFLDGKMGWVLSVNHYFYTMNKYVKLYYLYKNNGKL